MKRRIKTTAKKIARQAANFALSNHLVLFMILTTGFKQFVFNTWIIKVTWSTVQYQHGIIFGFLGAALIFSPLFFARRYKNVMAILLALVISVIIMADSVYFSYFASVPSVGVLASAGQAEDIGPAIFSFLNWWYLLFFADIFIIAATIKPINKLTDRIREAKNMHKGGRRAALVFIAITLSLFGATLACMGGDTIKNVMNRGYDMTSTTQHYGLIVTHGIDIIRFIDQETSHLSKEQINEVADWIKDNRPAIDDDEMTGIAKGKNVIMVQVESLGGFVINQKINDKEVTPNLDELAASSYYFPNERFLYGAGHTSDTDFVANSSYFPLDDAAVFIRYGRDDFTGLPKSLTSKGYSAYAYHGFNRSFWNRNVSLGSLGYQKFFASNNYPKGTKINMGLNDGDFLNKTADYIKEQPKPSLSYVITLSSHVPFSTNKESEELGIDKSEYPDQVGGYLETINYTDRMLGKFFDKLKSYQLYDDSLIIVYGDHTPVLPAFKAGSISYDPSSVQQKEVPLFIKLPKQTDGKTIANKGVHLDIMPTILDLLGVKTNQLMFGRSLFADKSDSYQDCPDQFETFTSLGGCENSLRSEKNISEKIVRYNLFKYLPK